MSHVIAAPTMDARPHRLASASPDRHDPVVRDLVEQATADAYARGHADGLHDGMATAVDHTDQLARSVSAALDGAGRSLAADRAACASEAVELALAIAESVLRREPHDGGAAVAATVRDVLAQLVDPAPTVGVHPGDRDLVASALADLAVTVQPDPSLQPGDAAVRGGWADVDLTRATAWSAIREALDDV